MGLDQNLIRKTADGNDENEIYWRKANFVHRYFTEDWQKRGFESDDCVEFPVTEDDLRTLADLCDYVLEHKKEAPYVLPTMSGFFFGSTEYGEWYFENVRYTKEEVEKLLANDPLQEGEEFYYYAWY